MDLRSTVSKRENLPIGYLLFLHHRRAEANADDLSRMAWLAIHSGQEELARDFVKEGLELEAENYHLSKLAQRLGLFLISRTQ